MDHDQHHDHDLRDPEHHLPHDPASIAMDMDMDMGLFGQIPPGTA